jgi:hypothetical protein
VVSWEQFTQSVQEAEKLARPEDFGYLGPREHDQMVEERKRLGAKGNALLLSQGFGS